MAQIPLDQAAVRRGIPRQTLEAWAEKGLLTLHPSPRSSKQAPASGDLEPDKLVDEDELDRVVESLGWLHLSEPGWEVSEGPEYFFDSIPINDPAFVRPDQGLTPPVPPLE
jgi:hypothetical protein